MSLGKETGIGKLLVALTNPATAIYLLVRVRFLVFSTSEAPAMMEGAKIRQIANESFVEVKFHSKFIVT